MKTMYCASCGGAVPVKKGWSWKWFIINIPFNFGIGYCLWYLIKPAKICKICGCKLS